MTLKEKDSVPSKKKTKDGNPAPVSGKVKVSSEIKKKAKELKKQAMSVGILTESESIALASQMALGLVNDRFGMDISVADRLKALTIIKDYHRDNKGISNQDALEVGDKLVVSVRKLAKETGK